MPAVMTSRLAAELDFAFERNHWGAEDVKRLSEGERLRLVLDYLQGRARIVPVEVGAVVVKGTVVKARTRCISEGEALMLDALDGTRTIAQSGDVFRAGVDSDFKDWGLNKKGKPTVEMPVEIHEMTENGTLAQIFGSMFGVYLEDGADDGKRKLFIDEHREDLRKLCIKSQDQVANFCEKFPDRLRKGGYGTFFLLEDEDTGNFFVARVDVYSHKGFSVRAIKLEIRNIWGAGGHHRFVIPKLAEPA